MTRPPFPLVWDNTMRSLFVSCPRKWAWESLHHFKPRTPNINLHAGAAWAKALEVAREAFYCLGDSSEVAIEKGLAALVKAYGNFECPPESPKSLNRLAEALVFYFDSYPLATDPAQPYVGKTGKPMIEFSFALPLDETLLHPETGEPLIYAGRADMVATYAGAVSIYDDKTTTSLGASWADQWDMRAQFTGYAWAALNYGIPVTQVLVRGIGILKTKLTTQQALSYRSEWRIERWHTQVVRDLTRAIQAWKEGYFDYNESDACSAYGGCIFKQPCQSQNPEPWLETNFIRRRWDPVARTEEELPNESVQ